MGSNFEDKVAAATDFLANRASQRRLTNHREFQAAVSEILTKRGQRTKDELSRQSAQRVLSEVDKRTWEDAGVLLSALVPHFWDNKAGRALARRLSHRGVTIEQAQAAVFDAYDGRFVPVSFSPPRHAPKDLDSVSAKGSVEVTGLTAADVRAIFKEELAKVSGSKSEGSFDRSVTLENIRDIIKQELQDA